MRLKFEYLFLLLILVTFSCVSNDDAPAEEPLDPDLGKSYFFLEPDKFREYEVYEIRYSAVEISDTLEYQLREEVSDSFVSNGIESRLIRRLTRNTSNDPWSLDSLWTARVEEGMAVSVENNLPLVKMVFPVDTSRRWDRNLLNGRDALTQRYLTFNEPFTQGINTFLRATEIQVSDDNDENPSGLAITFRDERTEVYADSIGLVRKEYRQLKFCSVGPCANQEIVQSGRYYREVLTAHGSLNEEGN
ncbi:hypothetical protein [Roseivirga misakiensis]|uniref:Uncharacterized protein n=1 Tax=Roseivirga misakiensis TaxID=1563681 RepID=A0A1E5SZV3_9BACT|nr:hypothetical protein [Roseivirga misakiensis]OEK04636.1 hypothetical protein BFP71_14365 [Roseivirga misakiensis]